MKQKTVDCLLFAFKELDTRERIDFYDEIVAKHSEHAVKRKLEELARRGYVAFQWETRHTTAEITEKGVEVIKAYQI